MIPVFLESVLYITPIKKEYYMNNQDYLHKWSNTNSQSWLVQVMNYIYALICAYVFVVFERSILHKNWYARNISWDSFIKIKVIMLEWRFQIQIVCFIIITENTKDVFYEN